MEQKETELKAKPFTKPVMQYAGVWEGMADVDVNEFLEEISIRRREAFSSRSENQKLFDKLAGPKIED